MTGQQQSGGLKQLSPKAVELGKVVFHVNMLSSFPLTSDQIADWATTIEELAPEITPERLRVVINQYKTGEMKYDRNDGIQNIFEGYRAVYGGRGLVH